MMQENEPLVAVKRLFSSNETEFQKEVSILKALDSKKNHPHLITLLATFKHQRKYHLVFRYADANLRQYWKDRPSPPFDKATVLWSLKQMTGMAHALESIHNFSVQYPLGVDGKVRLHKDAKPSADKKEKVFGRHGDIKPENILWFQQSSESKDENGTLQLADFGLGRFHSRKSRSNVPWDEAIGSPTYEPPECKLHRPVSRAYDIWSIGCLYLEFITWLLDGSAAITGLSDAQGKTATSTATHDNHFFTIIGGVPVVREEVVVWVQHLHEHEKCSALIHELLVIVMNDLLHPEAKMRAQARWLFHRLAKCLDRATEEEDYLLEPVPWPQKPNGPLHSKIAPIVDDAPRKSQKSVAFENEEKFGPSSEARFKPPKDLLGRNAGTPGLLKRSRTDGI
jgi:serine/threonine protein kinase